MPLFRRADGDVIASPGAMRRLMPLLMRTRTESAVYYEQWLDLTRTLPFLESWNAAAPGSRPRLTLFQLFLAALGRVLIERPGLNRFASGGRLYQRRGVHLSFAAKKAFADDGPLVTVKLAIRPGEPLAAWVERVHEAVGAGRKGPERPVDRELRLLARLPTPVLAAGMAGVRALDAINLLPGWFLRDDPLFCSAFVANLGSLGLDAAYHHLYEYGNASVFAVLGAARERLVPGPDGAPVTRVQACVRYTLDERINDGFYCARALELVRALVEDPERLVAA